MSHTHTPYAIKQTNSELTVHHGRFEGSDEVEASFTVFSIDPSNYLYSIDVKSNCMLSSFCSPFFVYLPRSEETHLHAFWWLFEKIATARLGPQYGKISRKLKVQLFFLKYLRIFLRNILNLSTIVRYESYIHDYLHAHKNNVNFVSLEFWVVRNVNYITHFALTSIQVILGSFQTRFIRNPISGISFILFVS